ncbi:hypothetical protein T439DRAFT_333638 [Meredithblackwellia eburnea MCA 4105]
MNRNEHSTSSSSSSLAQSPSGEEQSENANTSVFQPFEPPTQRKPYRPKIKLSPLIRTYKRELAQGFDKDARSHPQSLSALIQNLLPSSSNALKPRNKLEVYENLPISESGPVDEEHETPSQWSSNDLKNTSVCGGVGPRLSCGVDILEHASLIARERLLKAR